MAKIKLDYRSGFPLPEGRQVVECGNRGHILTSRTKLVQTRISIFDTSKFHLIDKGRMRVRHHQFVVPERSGVSLLDFGMCYHLFEHPNHIPRSWRQLDQIAFLGTLIGWLHPYTGYILEHVEVGAPLLGLTSTDCYIEPSEYISDYWDCSKIPVAAYKL